MESEAITQLSYDDYAVPLRNTISLLIQNATNMGFREGWFIKGNSNQSGDFISPQFQKESEEHAQ